MQSNPVDVNAPVGILTTFKAISNGLHPKTDLQRGIQSTNFQLPGTRPPLTQHRP